MNGFRLHVYSTVVDSIRRPSKQICISLLYPSSREGDTIKHIDGSKYIIFKVISCVDGIVTGDIREQNIYAIEETKKGKDFKIVDI